jgi:hypothetical protein
MLDNKASEFAFQYITAQAKCGFLSGFGGNREDFHRGLK